MSNKLFSDPKLTDAVTIARESIEVGLNDSGVAVVRVALARGKGTGTQEVPVADLPAFCDALEGYSRDGITKIQRTMSAVDMLHATIATDEDDSSVVTFRVGGGKGSKPTRVSQTALAGVVSFLRENLGRIEAAAEKIAKV